MNCVWDISHLSLFDQTDYLPTCMVPFQLDMSLVLIMISIPFLCRRENMGLTEILQHLKRRRPCIDPIPSFLDMLKTYESRCVAEGHLTVGGEKKAGNKTTDPESQSQQQRSQTPHRKRPIGPTMPAKNDSTRDDAPVSTSHEESSNSPKRVKK